METSQLTPRSCFFQPERIIKLNLPYYYLLDMKYELSLRSQTKLNQMNIQQLLLQSNPTRFHFQNIWSPPPPPPPPPDHVLRRTFFKCIRWQLEETMDPIGCPYHYYCDSIYPGDYPPAVDILVLAFTASTYLATLFIMVSKLLTPARVHTLFYHSKKYLIPSGPIFLPLFLFVLAKGHRINTVFPLSLMGPAILHLIFISALTFDNGADKDIKYVFFEASTVSGVLHASLNLDSVILPYYTGLDALVSSITFSGDCPSCVCRNAPLVVGGNLISYRGWSATTFVIVFALCARIICRLSHEKRRRRKAMIFKSVMEGLSWIFITIDCIYLTCKTPSERKTLQASGFVSIFVLVCIHILKLARQCQLMFYTTNRLEKV